MRGTDNLDNIVHLRAHPEFLDGLSPAARHALWLISVHDGQQGCFASTAHLAQLAGVSVRTWRVWVAELEAAGKVERVVGGGKQTSNVTVILPGGPLQSPTGDPCSLRQGTPAVSDRGKNKSKNQEKNNDESFDKFWARYPRSVGKPAARRAWNAALKRDGIDVIRAGFKAWTGYWRAEQTVEQFIPHPATWLNQARYNDAPAALDGQGRKVSAQKARAAVEENLAFGKAGM